MNNFFVNNLKEITLCIVAVVGCIVGVGNLFVANKASMSNVKLEIFKMKLETLNLLMQYFANSSKTKKEFLEKYGYL